MKFRLIESITLKYIHMNNSNTPKYSDNSFGQDLEPAGEYMNSVDSFEYINPNLDIDYGTITFSNPLILEFKSTGPNGWKKDLSEMFDNKTGKELSKAIMEAGYDGILTWEIFRGKKEWVEIVNLKGNKDEI